MVAIRRRTGLKGSNLDADASNNLYVRASESDNYVWDTGSLTWVKMTQPGGGVGSAVSIADGSDVVEGALADAAIVTDATGTINGKLRGLVKHAYERMPASLGQKTMALSLGVTIASDQTSFPVAATLAAETTKVIGTVNQGTSPWVVDGSAVTQPVSNIGLTDLDAAIGVEDSTIVPTKAVLVGGKSRDAVPTFEAIPIGPQGRSVLVEPIAPTGFDIAILRELRLLRQSFQDWTGTTPREDPIQVNS